MVQLETITRGPAGKTSRPAKLNMAAMYNMQADVLYHDGATAG
jgi:hypothetical protein